MPSEPVQSATSWAPSLAADAQPVPGKEGLDPRENITFLFRSGSEPEWRKGKRTESEPLYPGPLRSLRFLDCLGFWVLKFKLLPALNLWLMGFSIILQCFYCFYSTLSFLSTPSRCENIPYIPSQVPCLSVLANIFLSYTQDCYIQGSSHTSQVHNCIFEGQYSGNMSQALSNDNVLRSSRVDWYYY